MIDLCVWGLSFSLSLSFRAHCVLSILLHHLSRACVRRERL